MSVPPVDIAGNLAEVRRRIETACLRAGRSSEEVRLLAVSKRQPADAIEAAYRAGQREFGENYAQELADKATALAHLPGLRMRMIGHLQRNKVKRLVALGCAVDTVDSERLASTLDRAAGEAGITIEVLLQVNVAGESQKAGVEPDRLPALIETVRGMPHLAPRGLMTVPPASPDPEASRPVFANLRQLARAHALSELSMGMSADMDVAIEEGATIVRVGTAIFGPR